MKPAHDAELDDIEKLCAEINARGAGIAKAEVFASELWTRLLKAVGKPEAERIMSAVTGLKKPGRPESADAIDHDIKTYIKFAAYGLGKVSPKNIADVILARPAVKIARTALLKRIERARDTMIEEGELDRKYKKLYAAKGQ